MTATTTHTCAVLIVEDHPDTSEMIRWAVRRAGLTAEVADCGGAAIQFLEAGNRPACVVLDQMMPDMPGLEVLRRIKADPAWRDIHVFMYSASFEWRDQQAAEALGAEGWFVKGVSPLSAILRRITERCTTPQG